MYEPGWLKRMAEENAKEVAMWPPSMKRLYEEQTGRKLPEDPRIASLTADNATLRARAEQAVAERDAAKRGWEEEQRHSRELAMELDALKAKLDEYNLPAEEISAYLEWQEKDGPKCGTFQPIDRAPGDGPTYTTTVKKWRELVAERDALRADSQRLREILEAGEDDCWCATHGSDHRRPFERSEWVKRAEAALKSTPAQSLASVRSAAIREAAKECHMVMEGDLPHLTQNELLEMADRIEGGE